jgi:eukaryotic-like serine/threonine-protein kinase
VTERDQATGEPSEARLAAARPADDDLAQAVARARVASALFGVTEAVTIGRYRVLARLGSGGGGEVWSAWDPALDRSVALKLVRAAPGSTRARALEEGQALARLSHPNVVPVHDVFERDDAVVLVMEHVDGATLRTWVADRSATEIVRAYRQVAVGLAAMHAARLVHRDVKPDNAVVGADGRVRIVDLGLAVVADAAEPAARVAGTPRYMAPEQARGASVTPAADQYGLCASLREALSANGAAIPAWIAPTLERGLAAEPDARHPSMDAIVAALARAPERRRRRIAIGAAAAATVAVAFVAGRALTGDDGAPRCDGGAAAIAGAWGPAERAAAAARFAAATPYAAAAAPGLVAQLDAYAGRWAAQTDAACRKRLAGEASPSIADRRAACLARASAALDAVAALVDTIDAPELPRVVEAATALPALDRCDDDAALLAETAPPPPSQAAAAAGVADDLARARVLVDARRPDARTATAAVLERARALGYAPALARALLLDGRAHLYDPDGDRGGARFAEAVTVAIAAGDDLVAGEAFARQVWAAATSRAPRAPEGAALVDALAARRADGAFVRALLANNAGGAALAAGDRARARAEFATALAAAREVTGPEAIELLAVHLSVALVTDDDAARRVVLDELVARRTALLGAEHPSTLEARLSRGMLSADAEDAVAALTAACADLARYHPTASSNLADCWYEIALLREAAGDAVAARAALTSVVATAASGGDLAHVPLARAALARLDGRPREAIAALAPIRDELAAAGAGWWLDVLRAELELEGARAAFALGDAAAGTTAARDALALLAPVAERQQLAWITRRLDAARALTTRSDSPR